MASRSNRRFSIRRRLKPPPRLRAPQVTAPSITAPPEYGAPADPQFAGLQTSHADTKAFVAPPSSDPAVADLQKRLADVEGQLKKRTKPTRKPRPRKRPKNFRPQITGFTQLDTGFFRSRPVNRATVGDMQNGTGFRRARLAVKRQGSRVSPLIQIEVDFATAGRPSFFDVWVEQSNLPRLGARRREDWPVLQPFSVDSLTGFRNLTFLERSLPFLAMVPFRRVGIQSQTSPKTR